VTARLFFQVVSMEARRRMSYRVDFWINAIAGFAAEFAIVWFLWKAMFAESGATVIAGFTFEQVLVYYVVAILVAKIVRGTEFDGQASEDIYQGGLNRYLVFPAPYFAFKYAQAVGALLPAFVQAMVFGAGWWLVSDGAGMEHITLGGVLMAIGALALANFLYFMMAYSLHCVAFWADNVWSLLVALRFVTSLLGGLMVPLALFPDGLRRANEFLPFRNLFALPAEALLGRVAFAAWCEAMLVGVIWLGVATVAARIVWRRGNLQYSGVGI